jgi:transposase
LDLIATVIERLEGPREPGPGHPPVETVRVLATLRRFLRAGTPWRGLRATPTQASGSTLRRRLADWAEVNLLQRVHALLVAMLRGDPDLILDSCSVRAKRGGDLTGPNPTDRGKRGTKYHVAVTGDGVPVACAATAANVNDTLLFERLFLMAFAVVAKIGTVFADKGYDAEPHRELCRAFGAEPCVPAQARPAARLGAGQAALAGRAQPGLAPGEQAPGPSLRPARLRRPVAAPGRLSLPGCGTPRQGILKTASKWCIREVN